LFLITIFRFYGKAAAPIAKISKGADRFTVLGALYFTAP